MTPTRRPVLTLLLILASALALAGCASTTTTTVRAPSSAPAAAAPSASALAAAPSATPSPSEVACTSHSCIAQDAKGLVGAVAQNESVITAMSCEESTVKHLGPGIWTVRCTATYSDGSRVAGTATVLTSQDKVTWEPYGA